MKDKVRSIFEKSMNKKKVLILLIILIATISLICFFIKMNDKNQNIGNNMSNKNIKDIEEYILNISSYVAKVEVTIESNKNSNKYVMEQTYKKDSIAKQKVLEPSNIEGMEILHENNTLKISQTKIGLTTIYENYEYLVDNYLWLDSFIADYRETNGIIVEENENTIKMETKTRNSNNQYIYNKKLYIDKKTGLPIKLLIEDINQKKLVYILYNEIAVNGLK